MRIWLEHLVYLRGPILNWFAGPLSDRRWRWRRVVRHMVMVAMDGIVAVDGGLLSLRVCCERSRQHCGERESDGWRCVHFTLLRARARLTCLSAQTEAIM
jgi:hypothetical protein